MSEQTASDTPSSQDHFLDGPKLPPGITRFWLIRHALVEENARMCMYGSMDVPLCPDSLIAQKPMYRALAARLPRPAHWFVSPLSRTRETARAIAEAGYGTVPLKEEAELIEQNLGTWQGMRYAGLHQHLTLPPHPFWPVGATECPPEGESMIGVCARVGRLLDRLAVTNAGQDMVAVAHGGVIRAALAHALRIHAETALHFSVQNLSLTILEHLPSGWRVVTVNELPGI
ncbi:histidine phosphatase family protein [Acetobacter vaccinii]|uniref:Histidine phosphatase family protein n=1 Tax=Acetobacter vaccinii TaxID=2592655 RepID=A0A5C1YMB6_9PROT|nr:histidine phosphatase family protein [Acetobacter vaccinii]QEO17111.1 histidine phosphatase family protein [Acetobacter vaccinii]